MKASGAGSVDDTRPVVTRWRDQTQDVLTTLERFFGECDRLTEQLRDAERQAGALRAEISTLRDTVAMLEAERASLTATVARLERDGSALRAERERANESITSMLAEHARSISELGQKLGLSGVPSFAPAPATTPPPPAPAPPELATASEKPEPTVQARRTSEPRPAGLASKAMAVLAARPSYWLCVPCWTRAGGFSAVDDQATLSTLARAFRAGVFPDCEASETARCGTCGDTDGRGLRVRAKLGTTAAPETRTQE